jgi:putative tryptophan/tyrosine transport system substrate-binding protein
MPTLCRLISSAISLFADGFAVQNRERIFDFTTNRRIPVISGWPIFAESGALCTYGPDLAVSYRRLAYYVDRVLKGAKPAELPIEQPTKYELVLNLRSARKLGLTVPETILVRADKVIE